MVSLEQGITPKLTSVKRDITCVGRPSLERNVKQHAAT